MTKGPIRDLGFFFLFVVILGVIWFVQGGVTRPPVNFFIENKPEPAHFDSITGGSSGATDTNDDSSSPSSISGQEDQNKIFIYVRNAKRTNPDEEYIEIKASGANKTAINLAGWFIGGAQGLRLEIPQAVVLFKTSQTNIKSSMVLNPGEKMILVTGRSPLGDSFKINKCMGYLVQLSNIVPSISKDCPYPEDEIWSADLSYDCLDYIETLPRCEFGFTAPGLTNICREEINKKLNYNGCVDAHKNDEDFHEAEWRVYLDRSSEMWAQKRENITLTNKEGEVVANLEISN
ncbi:hypothetical protein ACFLZC_01655 [Patescibacteria group bacterium]